MTTQEQFAANRSNAQKSTGPKSSFGKSISRLNAMTHGATASLLSLKEEERTQFTQLRDAILAEYELNDEMGMELGNQFAWTIWRLRRIPASEIALLSWLKLRCEEIHDSKHSANYRGPLPHGTHLGLRDDGRFPEEERTIYEVGRFIAAALDGNYLPKLSRHEAHLRRQFRQIREDLEAHKRRTAEKG